MNQPAARAVAEWMLAKLDSEQFLYQEVVVYEIKELFGDEFVYVNENGNLAINHRVLREFRKLSEESVVWERSQRLWRRRAGYDPPGRQVD